MKANRQLSTSPNSPVNFINKVQLRRNAQTRGCNFKLSRALLLPKFSKADMNRFGIRCDLVFHFIDLFNTHMGTTPTRR